MTEQNVYMDIHTHIIPGVDDGSQSLDESVQMLEQAYEENIRVIVATPHFGVRNPDYDGKEAETKLNELRKIAEEKLPGLKLFMGNELYYSSGSLESLQKGWAHTIGGTKYVLLEFSTDVDYEKITRAIEEMNWNGYWPIIAHLERYQCLTGDLDAVRYLIDIGAYIQINCRTFIQRKTRKERKKQFFLEQNREWAMKLLKEGMVHFIASDCHSAGMRRPIFETAVSEIIQQGGEKEIRKITKANIVKLIRNERI